MSNKTHDYEKHAGEYAELEMQGTQYLAFRDISGSSHLSGELRVRMRGGEGRSGQLTPPVWSRTRSR